MFVWCDVGLAERIGFTEAIILTKINFWASKTKSGKVIKDRRWIFNSVRQWNEQFPFLTTWQVRSALDSLERQCLVDVGEFNKNRRDRTKWYAINYDHPDIADYQNALTFAHAASDKNPAEPPGSSAERAGLDCTHSTNTSRGHLRDSRMHLRNADTPFEPHTNAFVESRHSTSNSLQKKTTEKITYRTVRQAKVWFAELNDFNQIEVKEFIKNCMSKKTIRNREAYKNKMLLLVANEKAKLTDGSGKMFELTSSDKIQELMDRMGG